MRKIITAFILFLAAADSISQIPKRYDIVISELMADPSPQVGLPNNEWVELRNVSAIPVNLQGWRLADGGSSSGQMPFFILKPDSIVIVCGAGALSLMSSFGRAIVVTSFPTLDNDGDRLILLTDRNSVIHAVEYNSGWYRNEVKRNGGWALEMIDPGNPCAGMNNWSASTDVSGGTPGRSNSVEGVVEDNDGPQLIATITPDSLTIVALFDEPVDSAAAAMAANYVMSNNLTVVSATTEPPLFNRVSLRLSAPANHGIVYTLAATGIRDCKGNLIGNANKAKAGVPEPAADNDLVINEILFNPRPSGYDYIELFNRSNRIIDLSKLFVATRNTAGDIVATRVLVTTSRLIFPGEFLVITDHSESLIKEFHVPYPSQVIQLALPSMPDDEGKVILMGAQGKIIDELNYTHQWHFPLISASEGVALERIDPDGPSEKLNWHSAASTVGYGTPTYRNSQYMSAATGSGSVDVSKIFSPDNDGREDVAMISYQVEERGYVGRVTIFNTGGMAVRQLVKNDLLSLRGSWTWDGLGENRQKLPVGNYIVYSEFFNLQGKRLQFKKVVVLARKL